MRPRQILSTCGTSLLTNKSESSLRSLLTKHANDADGEIPSDARERIDRHVDVRRRDLMGADEQRARTLSAELNGLLAYYGGKLPASSQDQLWLLRTDTFLGSVAAELVAEWLSARGLRTQITHFGMLRTRDLDGFRIAVAEVARWCGERHADWCGHYHVVYNLTGGFKSINGFLQALGMLYADEVVYLFEGEGGELLRLPALPVRLDFAETIRAHLDVFRRLANHEELPVAQAEGLPATLLYTIDDRVALSAWGEAGWGQFRRAIYREKVWPSPHPRLELGPGFEKSVDKLPADRVELVNTRLDDLARYLSQGQNTHRLDLKPLRGNPVKGSTHECDAWADGAAKRLFLHWEDDVLVVDRLDDHL